MTTRDLAGSWIATHFGQLGCEICTSLIFTCLDSHLCGVPEVEVLDAFSWSNQILKNCTTCIESDAALASSAQVDCRSLDFSHVLRLRVS